MAPQYLDEHLRPDVHTSLCARKRTGLSFGSTSTFPTRRPVQFSRSAMTSILHEHVQIVLGRPLCAISHDTSGRRHADRRPKYLHSASCISLRIWSMLVPGDPAKEASAGNQHMLVVEWHTRTPELSAIASTPLKKHQSAASSSEYCIFIPPSSSPSTDMYLPHPATYAN